MEESSGKVAKMGVQFMRIVQVLRLFDKFKQLQNVRFGRVGEEGEIDETGGKKCQKL